MSKIHHNPITWFLVADGARAQVYVRERVKNRIPMGGAVKRRYYEERVEQTLVPVAGMHWQAESPEEYQTGNDLMGRAFESVGSHRHAYTPHIDVREEIKLRFMRNIAEHLEIAHREKLFNQLMLIASPRMLGELKKQLSSSILAQVVAELPKDMTHYEGRELAAQVERII